MCFYCKGDMRPGKTLFSVQYGNSVIVIKNVPCMECVQCGETEISDEVMKQLETMIETVKKTMQEIAVIDYTKVA